MYIYALSLYYIHLSEILSFSYYKQHFMYLYSLYWSHWYKCHKRNHILCSGFCFIILLKDRYLVPYQYSWGTDVWFITMYVLGVRCCYLINMHGGQERWGLCSGFNLHFLLSEYKRINNENNPLFCYFNLIWTMIMLSIIQSLYISFSICFIQWTYITMNIHFLSGIKSLI